MVSFKVSLQGRPLSVDFPGLAAAADAAGSLDPARRDLTTATHTLVVYKPW